MLLATRPRAAARVLFIGSPQKGSRRRPFSGHAGEMAIPAQTGSLVAGVHGMGRGSVVYLVDNPLFRAFWKSGHRFFDNAVFLGPSM